jgi:hypothetical protein
MKGLKYILGFFIILISFSISAQSSEEPTLIEKWKIKKSERKAKKRAKAAYKELERNYKQRQHDHYMMQDERTKQRMRDGQAGKWSYSLVVVAHEKSFITCSLG